MAVAASGVINAVNVMLTSPGGAELALAAFEGPKPEFMLIGRSGRWPEVRKAYLAQYPTCAICKGDEYLQVHHVMPYHLYPERELDSTNLITLCEKPSRNCHFTWGHLYNWKNWNPRIAECVRFWDEIRRTVRSE